MHAASAAQTATLAAASYPAICESWSAWSFIVDELLPALRLGFPVFRSHYARSTDGRLQSMPTDDATFPEDEMEWLVARNEFKDSLPDVTHLLRRTKEGVPLSEASVT